MPFEIVEQGLEAKAEEAHQVYLETFSSVDAANSARKKAVLGEGIVAVGKVDLYHGDEEEIRPLAPAWITPKVLVLARVSLSKFIEADPETRAHLKATPIFDKTPRNERVIERMIYSRLKSEKSYTPYQEAAAIALGVLKASRK